jgi:hypothetical protein
MTTGSSPPGARRSLSYYPQADRLFQLACGHLIAGAFVVHARPLDLRSARAWFVEIAASRLTTSQSRPLASPCWSGRRPATRSAENDQIRSLLALELLDESLSPGPPHTERSLNNANGHRFDPALEKEGRAVLRGRPLRGRHSKNTDLCGRPCDRPSHVTLPHRGLAGSGAGGSALVLALCPTWALTAGG